MFELTARRTRSRDGWRQPEASYYQNLFARHGLRVASERHVTFPTYQWFGRFVAHGVARALHGGDFVRATPALPDPVLVDDGRGSALLLMDTDDDGDLDVLFARDQSNESVRNTRVFVNPR